MNEPAIEFEAVTCGYNGSPALESVNLSVPRGDYLAVLGPNGGGKTTLLKLLLGLLTPDSGTVRVLGQVPGEASRRVGYMPQFTATGRAFPISVLQTVLLGRL